MMSHQNKKGGGGHQSAIVPKKVPTYKGFPIQWQKDINVAVISALSSIKLSQFFEILIFSQDILLGKHSFCPWNQPHCSFPKELW